MSATREDPQRQVTLYRLERRLEMHRDTLERLCLLRSIPILNDEGKRCIGAEHVEELGRAVAEYRGRPRPWGR